MRKAALALIICFSIQTGSLYAGCKSDLCKQAVAWEKGYTAIVLDDNISRADYFAVLNVVKANKGVVAIEAERVLLGWVPITTAVKIRAARGVSAVLYEAVPRPADLVHRDEALAALSYFNRVQTGEFEDTVEAGLAVTGPPLTGCVLGKPTSRKAQVQSIRSVFDSQPAEENSVVPRAEENLTNGDDRAALPRLPGVVSPMWDRWFNPPWRNPQMRGRITVQLFRLDSDGSIDPNLYTWTNADIGTSRDQVYSSFNFWVDQAAARGITLSFRVETEDPFSRYTRSIFPTPTHYEPITHSSGDDYLWINDALAANGYGASPVTPDNVYSQNEAFNQAKAADPTYGPFDGSYSVFIVYNPGSAPSTFTDGYYAYVRFLGGPFVMMTWNGGYLDRVLSHETGHIFWACDEYHDAQTNRGCQSCYYCTYNVGPRNQVETPWVTNANCDYTIDNSGPTCDVPRTSCMMKYQSPMLCPHTPAQIGW